MPQSHADVLYATDTALRLVHQALGDLGTTNDVAFHDAGIPRMEDRRSGGAQTVASTLLCAYAQLASLLDDVKQSRDRLPAGSDAPSAHTHEQMGLAVSVIADAQRRLERLTGLLGSVVLDAWDASDSR